MGWDIDLKLEVEGRQGPPRTQAEADAEQAASLAAIDQKHARLAELQTRFEAEGHPPERARVMAAQAYHQD